MHSLEASLPTTAPAGPAAVMPYYVFFLLSWSRQHLGYKRQARAPKEPEPEPEVDLSVSRRRKMVMVPDEVDWTVDGAVTPVQNQVTLRYAPRGSLDLLALPRVVQACISSHGWCSGEASREPRAVEMCTSE